MIRDQETQTLLEEAFAASLAKSLSPPKKKLPKPTKSRSGSGIR